MADRLTAPHAGAPTDAFRVALGADLAGALVHDHRRLMCALARLESWVLKERLAEMPIAAPVWIAGLARSGTTILLEILAEHPDAGFHRYRDFPPVFTPYLWDRFLELVPRRKEQPKERAHGDGIEVTSASPEAFEEPLWMAFFPDLHEPGQTALLDRATRNPAFEAFLRDHIRKLLIARGRPRYLAKANYNATRLDYLLRLFPDARFIVPVRAPDAHVASLMQMHRLFSAAGERFPAARRHLARVGHFEFGLDRRPIDCGDAGAVAEIGALRSAGREAEAWALQWAQLYGFLARRLSESPALAEATLVVRHEDLCGRPGGTLAHILEHCRLASDADLLARAVRLLRPAEGAGAGLGAVERKAIRDRTAEVAARYGYSRESSRRAG